MSKINACPFCGQKESVGIESVNHEIYVLCSSCYSRGPEVSATISAKYDEEEDEAISKWNKGVAVASPFHQVIREHYGYLEPVICTRDREKAKLA